MKRVKTLCRIVCLCLSLVLLLSGCCIDDFLAEAIERIEAERMEAKLSEVELTEEQESQIDRFVDVREGWETYKEIVNTYYINRVYISEDEEGNTLFSVAYEEETRFGYSCFAECGYRVTADRIICTYADRNWMGSGTEVDLETISDEQLREVLRQSYKKYLSKK